MADRSMTASAIPADVTEEQIDRNMVETACAAYAKVTGYYTDFHPGLLSVSSNRMREGMRAALEAALTAQRAEPAREDAGAASYYGEDGRCPHGIRKPWACDECDASILAALSQSPSASASEGTAEGWRPIETCREAEGVTVLTQHVDDLFPVAAFRIGSDWRRNLEGPEDQHAEGKWEMLYRNPTHWMPLPAAPNPQKQGAGE